ncbi:CgeB family protein [Rothia terrae]|uniref:CgeB family protein n=1 Tax=Rothia terrae TaxID=396015 RepID=UPI0033D59048
MNFFAKNFKHFIIPLLIATISIIFSISTENIIYAFIGLIIFTVFSVSTVYTLKNREILYEVATKIRNSQNINNSVSQKIDSLYSGQIDNTARSKNTENSIGRIERRLIRHEAVINNTAGSVGRMAPVVRDIKTNLNSLPQRASTSPVPSASASHTTGSVVTAPKTYSFPPVKPISSAPTFSDVKVAVVADEFTAKAFSYEWNTFEPTPSNWKSLIDQEKPAFLFVESAWEANERSWLYHLVGQTAPRPAVIEMVAYCKENGIPTVFWNKEDPPHFEEFLPTAALFDYVFTTDGNLIEEYKKRLGHDNFAVLPFAAQPKIHNPARIIGVPRDRDIVFGGMYFREKYPERRQQMDMILPAAKKFELDIYSRNNGQDIKYRFPDQYLDSVVGNLPYPQMLTAYHAYKTVINVNSVTNSETMCARRIFEATACGAAVVTSSTPAIRNFFPDEMLTEVFSEDDATNKIRALTRSS